MNRRWLYAGLIAGAAGAGIILLSRGERRPRAKPGDRVLVVGDSLGVGLSVPLRALAAEEGVALEARAKNGSTVPQWLRSGALATHLTQYDPTLVLVVLGTNDAYMRLEEAGVASWLEDVRSLVERLRAGGADVGWVMPPTLPDPYAGRPLHDERLDLLEELLVGMQVPLFRSEAIDVQRAQDGLHATVMGYAGWAGEIWRWITR